ncbi:hypothetical protein GLAREA_12582 [Glarea lozoyensis ATCC 20868]|uniref:Heterokaryon incompatibility domain-containing protein n=1 Tax=Glarea lozoyensis (strain ATCC 20868 / MF5171) TaxID=1116229 RepID=S3D2C8_GLAL2|nr:uncharacterized protein GLAREA_12582 [Glarea lozoyensis ATCC 20868]EPE31279.1 hypothetical protein GLAREA_12582 [Glarea lozoyensis ATCC 20868]
MDLDDASLLAKSTAEFTHRHPPIQICTLCKLLFESETRLPTARTIPQQIFQTPEGYYFHRTTQELELSANEGCKFCTDVFKHHPLRNDWKFESKDWKVTLNISYDALENRLVICGWRASDLWLGAYWRKERMSVLVDWHLFTYSDNPAAQYITGRIPYVGVGSSRSYETARAWLNECIEHHDDCKMPDIVILPKRLVEVSPLGAIEGARLAQTEGLVGNYYALSYCWGKPQPFSTKSDIVEKYSESLPIDALPQSILDAMEVTRQLGVRFLWIDSLCIIQDDPADLANELGNMGRIYQNAQLTISAASAADCTKGFLSRRSGAAEDENPRSCSLNVDKHVFGNFVLSTHSNWDGHWSRHVLPINSRAWTLQETLLAQRLLIYGNESVVWKCQSPSANKPDWYRSAGFLDYSTSDIIGTRIPDADQGMGVPPVPYDDQNMVKRMMWGNTVCHYNRRDLSNKQDKLPAISAAAEFFSKFLGPEPGDYLAGLWRGTLVYDLLWYIEDDDLGSRDVSNHLVAPSWSWASVSGRISDSYVSLTAQGKFVSTVDIVSCSVNLSSIRTPFGEVRGGELVILGHLTHLLIGPGHDIYGRIENSRLYESDTRKAMEDTKITWDTVDDFKRLMMTNRLSLLPNGADPYVPASVVVLGYTLWEDDCESVWYKTARGLVLQTAPGGSGYYSRIGTFESRCQASRACWWEESKISTVNVI